MENLGHNSKAVHRAYAKRALVNIPSLEDCEKKLKITPDNLTTYPQLQKKRL